MAKIQSDTGKTSYADSYDSLMQGVSRWMADRAVDHHQLAWEQSGENVRGIRLMDIACGLGYFTLIASHRLQKTSRSHHILCTDASRDMLAFASRHCADPFVEFRTMNGQDLSVVSADTFDGANCLFGVDLMPDPPGFFKQVKRVLRPGGISTIGTWARYGLGELADAFSVYLGLTEFSENSHTQWQDTLGAGSHPNQLLRSMTEAGFLQCRCEVLRLEITVEADDREVLFGAMMADPFTGPGFAAAVASQHSSGAILPSLDQFKGFLQTSPLAAPFWKAEKSDEMLLKFECNLGIATA